MPPQFLAPYDNSGNVLTDPIVPAGAFTGASILKVAVAIGIFVYLFRKFGK